MSKKLIYGGVIVIPLVLIGLLFWLLSGGDSETDPGAREASAESQAKSQKANPSAAGSKAQFAIEAPPSKELYLVPTMPAEPPLMPDVPPPMIDPPPMPDAPSPMPATPPPMPMDRAPAKR